MEQCSGFLLTQRQWLGLEKGADGALCSGMICKILPSSSAEVLPVPVGLLQGGENKQCNALHTANQWLYKWLYGNEGSRAEQGLKSHRVSPLCYFNWLLCPRGAFLEYIPKNLLGHLSVSVSDAATLSPQMNLTCHVSSQTSPSACYVKLLYKFMTFRDTRLEERCTPNVMTFPLRSTEEPWHSVTQCITLTNVF